MILLKYLSTIQGICSFRKNTASHSIYEKKRNNKSISPIESKIIFVQKSKNKVQKILVRELSEVLSIRVYSFFCRAKHSLSTYVFVFFL